MTAQPSAAARTPAPDSTLAVECRSASGPDTRIRFRLDTPGTYAIICSVEGHAEAGMVGRLVVTR